MMAMVAAVGREVILEEERALPQAEAEILMLMALWIVGHT